MKRVSDDDRYRFSSGKALYANRGLISIAENEGVLVIGEGYDTTIEDQFGRNDWTPEERMELAEYMIEQWKKFQADAQRMLDKQTASAEDADGRPLRRAMGFQK